MSDTITLEKERVKMDVKTLGAMGLIVVSATATVCGLLNSIRSDMRQYHEDCAKSFSASWQVRDEVERVYQQKQNHGVEPEVSEVLRVTRPANEKEKF